MLAVAGQISHLGSKGVRLDTYRMRETEEHGPNVDETMSRLRLPLPW